MLRWIGVDELGRGFGCLDDEEAEEVPGLWERTIFFFSACGGDALPFSDAYPSSIHVEDVMCTWIVVRMSLVTARLLR